MERLNSWVNIIESTDIDNNGFSTLHTIPRYDLEYFLLISLDVSSRITKKYCFLCSLF